MDWIPTLNLGYTIKIKRKKRSEPTEPHFEEVQCDPHDVIVDESNIDDTGAISDVPEILANIPTNFVSTVSTQTDDRLTGMSVDVLVSYQQKIAHLLEMLCSKNVKEEPENFEVIDSQ